MRMRKLKERNRISYDDVQVVVKKLGLQGEWIKIYCPKSILFKFKTYDSGAINLRCYKRKERVYCQGKNGLGKHLDSMVKTALAEWNRGCVLFPPDTPAPEDASHQNQLSETKQTGGISND